MARPKRLRAIEGPKRGKDGIVRWRGIPFINGKQDRGPWTTSEEEAILYRDTREQEAKAGLLVGQKLTVSEAITGFTTGIANGTILNRNDKPYRPKVVKDYTRDLKRVERWLGKERVDAVRLEQVNIVKARLREQGLSDSTIRNTLAGAFQAMYTNWAMQIGLSRVNPCDGLRLPINDERRRERIATPEECALLTAALDFPDRTGFALAWGAGLRGGEAFGMDWTRIDLARGVLHVECQWDVDDRAIARPKTENAYRTIPIRRMLRLVLEDHAERYGTTGLLLRSLDGRPGRRKVARPSYEQLLADHQALRSYSAMGRKYGVTEATIRKWIAWYQRPPAEGPQAAMSYSAFSRRIKKRWATAELEPLGMHEARHTFASVLIDLMVAKRGGVNLKALTYYMGHASTQITLDRYGHLFPGNEAEVRQLLDDYDREALSAFDLDMESLTND